MRRQAGFTLLELLIAITLLGLLTAALFGGLRLGMRAWEISGERLGTAARVEMVQHFLRERLMQIYPLPASEGQRRRLVFDGERKELTFATLLSDRLGTGLGLVSLRLGDDRALQLRWQPLRGAAEGDDGGEVPKTRRLLDRIERIEFSYYGGPEVGGPRAWYDEWIDSTTLPELIHVRVVFPPGDQRVWLNLVVHPMIEAMPPVPKGQMNK